MDTIVDYLCDYTHALAFGDLPTEVVRQAKRLLVDTLGCAIGGYASEPSKIARALADAISSRQPATVLLLECPRFRPFPFKIQLRRYEQLELFTEEESS